MGKRPLIGVAGSHNIADRQFFVRENYMESVLRAGGMPVLLPEVEDVQLVAQMLDHLDGLLLAGGDDVHPGRYGEEILPVCGDIDLKRDAFEMQLFPMALERGLPVLGICRGIQVMAVALGGTLYQDIESQCGIPKVSHQQPKPYNAPAHDVHFVQGGLLERVTGTSVMPANSMHHQSIKHAGPMLRVEGTSEDGIVEAVSYVGNENVLGVQFHPEYLSGESVYADRLFENLVKQARTYMEAR